MNFIKYRCFRQVAFVFYFLLFFTFFSCNSKNSNIKIIPPATQIFSEYNIAYGVVNVSYVSLKLNPGEPESAKGFLREGAIVKIIERKVVIKNNLKEIWVYADADYDGWLLQNHLDVYEREAQAITASKAMKNE
jgi:hypothetical protein